MFEPRALSIDDQCELIFNYPQNEPMESCRKCLFHLAENREAPYQEAAPRSAENCLGPLDQAQYLNIFEPGTDIALARTAVLE